jgi:IMP dehydrogenase
VDNRTITEALTYQDVLLVPQYSDIRSRKEVDISSESNGLVLPVPVIASPMDTVSENSMADAMNACGGLAIIHRYNSPEEQAWHVSNTYGLTGAAIGMTGDFRERAQAVIEAGAEVLCVDVAHGHHISMRTALEWLKNNCGDVHIIAGNVATLDGFNALADWGADSVRCNIGGGSICTTRTQTGHGVPGLHTIFDCAKSENAGSVGIIADGGIRNSGDIVKALAAGADFVMLGSLLAGTTEAPGRVIFDDDGKQYKAYRGMASREAQKDWRGHHGTPEGVASRVPFRGSVTKIIEDLAGGVRSGFSYTGARNIRELQSKARFIRQTAAGQVESSAHIYKR